jgi:hypothetical protein
MAIIAQFGHRRDAQMARPIARDRIYLRRLGVPRGEAEPPVAKVV